MPLVDMPLDKLKNFYGSNPCPGDMDEYWDAAIAEMKAVEAKTELVRADFQVPCAECFDLFFTGVGGSRIHAKYIRPKNPAQPHPAVVQFHGYFDFAGPWSSKLSYVSQGYSIATLDARGQAGLSEDLSSVKGTTFRGHIVRGLEDSPEKLLFRSIFLDAAQLAGIIMAMPEVCGDRVGVIGDSQGGGIALACASLEPKIRRAAVAYPFLCDYKRVWEMDLDKESYIELADFLRQRDPLHEHENEIFTRLGYIDIKNLVKRVRAEVLMGVGLMDTTVPASTQFAAYNGLTSPKSMKIYPDFGHEPIPHFQDEVFRFIMGL